MTMKSFYPYLILPTVALLVDMGLFLAMVGGISVADGILMGSFAGLAAALLFNTGFFVKAL